jgi:polyphosphate glucokinase
VAVLGIDIGGSGIKGAPVDPRSGRLLADRLRLPTPQPATPDAVVGCLAEIIDRFDTDGTIGVTFPGVVTRGVIRTAANVDKSWVGCDLPALVHERTGRVAAAINDADAAGVAEVAHGAARRTKGVLLMLTFGTGVGSGLFVDGRLVPNTELGHLEYDGKDAEKRVAESVRERKQWSWAKWATRTNGYLAMLDALFCPDLIVLGGGIAKNADEFMPLLRARAPLRVAALGNEAGIIGAAMTAHAARARVPAA